MSGVDYDRLRRRRRRPRGTAVRFIDGIAGPSEANVIGHSIISIGDIDQLSSDARKTCLPSQASYAERHFSIVSAASLEKIAHFHLPLSRMGSCAHSVNATSKLRPLAAKSRKPEAPPDEEEDFEG
jgi:hypothetical protein